MAKSGIRVKIQVTIGYLITIAVVSFICGIIVAAIVVGAR